MKKRLLLLLCVVMYIGALRLERKNLTPKKPQTTQSHEPRRPEPQPVRKKHEKVRGRVLKSPDCGTHVSVLVAAVAQTDGPVLELGMGDWSTPLLHALCARNKRFLLSAETDRHWISYFLDLENDWHHFEYVPIFEDSIDTYCHPERWDAVGNETRWSVVFIDHAPEHRRLQDINRLRENTDIFVVHDTEAKGYGLDAVLKSFKYCYVEDRYTIETTIVSDTIDVTKFFV